MEYKVPENPSENRKGDFTPLVVISAILVTLYLIANLMAVKVIRIGSISLFDAGTITFPFTYMLGDILAEVWLFTGLGVLLPYPDYMQYMQDAYATVYTYVPRIVVASLISFLLGGLANAKGLVLIRRFQSGGRNLWIRTIGSSAIGYLFDTVFFVLIAFAGTVPASDPASDIVFMIVVQYVAKLVIEVLFGTPFAYGCIGFLRKRFI